MNLKKVLSSLAAATILTGTAFSQDDRFAGVEVTAEHVRGNIHVLFGAGGNIGVSLGEDGVYIVDDQFAPLSDKIRAAIKGLSDKPIKYVINTHFHGDHTGGNENFGKTGSVIVAHDNVRVRMAPRVFEATENKLGEKSLPVVTFNDEMSLHLNGEETRIVHVSRAHTDGDSLVYFKGNNVLHMGDTFFANRFPFIDTRSGGTIGGLIETIATAIDISNSDTLIIPGHGPVSKKPLLIEYYQMLIESRDRVVKLKNEGKSLEEIVAMKPLADMDARWQTDNAEWPDRYVGFIYSSL
ncbi:MBL fold metallo-hydrolase [Kordiimonas sp. SCSIO 12610]|uniref:MBL fold metallo-hydrolase n=1 Tax=Kordiimonas sp. SCSIO 12610 TaxID=2829597 RepID=UPI00210A5659|nr:MBL fold metallo-hydrolase [Kordiimonas sp. SCSIO 12610]UTW55516.1 MBL fold metallo-hydrolase [Kordiimonas sp. SCSIO 12610]